MHRIRPNTGLFRALVILFHWVRLKLRPKPKPRPSIQRRPPPPPVKPKIRAEDIALLESIYGPPPGPMGLSIQPSPTAEELRPVVEHIFGTEVSSILAAYNGIAIVFPFDVVMIFESDEERTRALVALTEALRLSTSNIWVEEHIVHLTGCRLEGPQYFL